MIAIFLPLFPIPISLYVEHPHHKQDLESVRTSLDYLPCWRWLTKKNVTQYYTAIANNGRDHLVS